MTSPKDDDSSVQTPPLQGGHTPDNINICPRPPVTGEEPSGGDAPPISATGSLPLILGYGHHRPQIQGHLRPSAIGRGPLPARPLGYIRDPYAVVGGGGEGSGGERRRKRTRDEAFGALSSRVVGDHNPIPPPRPPPPPPPPPPQLGPFACIMCEHRFRSKKSLSRHMRMHNDRDWRGSYPPPTFSMQEFYDDDNARAHLNSPPIDEDDGGSRVVDRPPGLEGEDRLNERARDLNPPPVALQVVELEEGKIIDEDLDRDIRNVAAAPPNLDINNDVNHLEEQGSRIDVLGSSNLRKAELPDLNKEPPPDCD